MVVRSISDERMYHQPKQYRGRTLVYNRNCSTSEMTLTHYIYLEYTKTQTHMHGILIFHRIWEQDIHRTDAINITIADKAHHLCSSSHTLINWQHQVGSD